MKVLGKNDADFLRKKISERSAQMLRSEFLQKRKEKRGQNGKVIYKLRPNGGKDHGRK